MLNTFPGLPVPITSFRSRLTRSSERSALSAAWLRAGCRSAIGALILLVSGCASQAPAPASSAPTEESRTALACIVPTNCVNSLDSGGIGPLRYAGTPTQALAVLRATLAQFPEARIVSADGLAMLVVFTTPQGFRDQVDFRIDAQAQRIDYRSRSSFGLFDFGKNRSRMVAVADRFDKNARR